MLYFRTLLLLIAFSLLACPCSAKIYKYQKDGVWHYTDSPPEDQIEKSQEMVESARSAPAPSQGAPPLLEDHVARNAIEEAAAATVAIKTTMGYGSGFFISTSGHIITNKHVIRPLANKTRKKNNYYNKVDNNIKNAEEKIENEETRLNNYKKKVAESKHRMETARNDENRQYYKDQYEYRKEQYEIWEERLQNKKKNLEVQKKKYDKARGEYNYQTSVASLSNSFTITLVDDTELQVHLLSTSKNHDLALLKLDGYKTPKLDPGSPNGLAQGDPVYAIGNPVKLRNTVTSGIFSGFEGKFIQTNAQINPGNSGGPLIDAKGKVLGINTKKKVGKTIEGLGFAIPIKTAINEFSAHLP
ncbi:MAG: trypsin-like peptidase domain-containing protein [Desulfobacteraceae bacterium]|jgi:S1-C subfamily serine protease